MILVDTGVWFDFFAGVEPSAGATERLLVEKRAALSATTAFELRAGVIGKKRLQQIARLVGMVPLLPLTTEVALIAGELYTTLKAKGRLVGNEDLFLAATALEIGVPVLTLNRKHFERVPDLEVLDPAEVVR